MFIFNISGIDVHRDLNPHNIMFSNNLGTHGLIVLALKFHIAGNFSDYIIIIE